MKTRHITLALVLCALAGCAPILAGYDAIQANPRAAYLATQESFNTVTDALADLREAGTFTVDEADEITEWLRVADEALGKWEQALLDDWQNVDPEIPRTANRALTQLKTYLGGQ